MTSQFSIKVFFLFFLSFFCCSSSDNSNKTIPNSEEITFYLGADLSYVNEMEDCGAVYKEANAIQKDPFEIFKEAGSNLVRVRLWHDPKWTNYSNYNDVEKTIKRAKNQGMKVLLDFHYSDTWADPSHQEIPATWLPFIDDTQTLGELLYTYTFETLEDLSKANLLPDIVQIGNEINAMILQNGDLQWPIDWDRNAHLINKGVQAVRDISAKYSEAVGVMLHIAQPENALWWFEQATQNGVADFDWIGLSYYPQWSEYNLDNLQTPLTTLIKTYNKRLMIVETAYPYTLSDADSAGNILGEEALISNYPASQQGQLDYLNQLLNVVENAGGEGIIYWEPAWVSTNCSTQWGKGSHWDNATLFDHNNTATLGLQFYNATLNN